MGQRRRLPREVAMNRAMVKGPESEGEYRQSSIRVCSGEEETRLMSVDLTMKELWLLDEGYSNLA